MSKNQLDWNFPLVLWYIDSTANAASTRIHIHQSASYKYVSCMMYECTRFISTWCILSTITPVCGFPVEASLVLIPYSFYIKIFKLVTKEFSSLVIRDIYFPWMPYQSRSFHQFCDLRYFLVAVFCYFRPPSYGVYHCNSFLVHLNFFSTHHFSNCWSKLSLS